MILITVTTNLVVDPKAAVQRAVVHAAVRLYRPGTRTGHAFECVLTDVFFYRCDLHLCGGVNPGANANSCFSTLRSANPYLQQ